MQGDAWFSFLQTESFDTSLKRNASFSSCTIRYDVEYTFTGSDEARSVLKSAALSVKEKVPGVSAEDTPTTANIPFSFGEFSAQTSILIDENWNGRIFDGSGHGYEDSGFSYLPLMPEFSGLTASVSFNGSLRETIALYPADNMFPKED